MTMVGGMRILLPPVVILALAACTPPGPRTLVYGFEEAPDGRLDRNTCIVGAGLKLDFEVDLGISESIGFDIAADQNSALLATCDLEGDSIVGCGILDPPVPLDIVDNTVTGFVSLPVVFADTDCDGANFDMTWTMELDEEQQNIDGAIEAVWRLDDTPECDLFEAEILDAFEGNGRVDGCVVDYTFTARQVGECRVRGDFLDCG